MNERTLANNKISQFILRIDLTPDSQVDFATLADKLKGDYGSLKTELKVNFNVNVQTVEVRRENYVSYNLGDVPAVTLKLDTFEKSIILISVHYDNNEVYKNKLHHIVEAIKSVNPDVKAQRIGMRYINKFACVKKSDISKCLNASEAKTIKDSLEKNNIARSMIVHEFQCDSHMTRVQCGIPNRFYPSVISNYDLILDIDVYGTGIMSVTDWEDNVSEYNHGAYDTFINYTKDSLVQSLK